MVNKKIKKNEVNKIINITSISKTSNIELINEEGYYKDRYYFTQDDFFDDQKLKRLIKGIERDIRQSDEYSNYIGFLKNEIGLNRCAILGNVEGIGKVTIEQHHYPFTLYDIVFLNILLRLKNKEKINTFIVSEDILKDHYNNIIGLVPLCETVHQLVHDGKIFISLDSVWGDLNKFIEKYGEVLTDDMINNYNKLIDMTKKGVYYSDENILQQLNDKLKDL